MQTNELITYSSQIQKNFWNLLSSVIRHITPIFNIGWITACFNLVGNIPEGNILLQMWHSGELLYGELIFGKVMDISS